MTVSPYFFLSSARMLISAQTSRLLLSSGVSHVDMQRLRGPALWMADQRVRVRTTLDACLFAACDMSGLPRVDIPAELAAAHVAVLVDPINWMVCASWLADLKPARDLAEAQQSVQIERVSAGRFLSLVLFADASMRSLGEYEQFARKIGESMTLSESKMETK